MTYLVDDVREAAWAWTARSRAGHLFGRHHLPIEANDRALSATTASGLRFSFHDARAELGRLVGFYQPHQAVLDLYAQVADASRGRDGRDPVRVLP